MRRKKVKIKNTVANYIRFKNTKVNHINPK